MARARAGGLRAGLIRPVSLWPFPSAAIRAVAPRLRGILVVELSAGQMIEDVRLAVEGRCPVAFTGRTGGMVPTPGAVVDALRLLWATTEARGQADRTRSAEGIR
jgi:2-oxoglutarate ferredoxin oxidoreductase subunit alpha